MGKAKNFTKKGGKKNNLSPFPDWTKFVHSKGGKLSRKEKFTGGRIFSSGFILSHRNSKSRLPGTLFNLLLGELQRGNNRQNGRAFYCGGTDAS